MERVPHTRDYHFGGGAVVVDDRDDLADEVHSVVADVVEPAHEGAHLCSSAFRFTASALIGPSTIEQISAMTCLKSLPSLAISEGLVVTPSTTPRFAASRISFTSAVSKKNMPCPFSFVICRALAP